MDFQDVAVAVLVEVLDRAHDAVKLAGGLAGALQPRRCKEGGGDDLPGLERSLRRNGEFSVWLGDPPISCGQIRRTARAPWRRRPHAPPRWSGSGRDNSI